MRRARRSSLPLAVLLGLAAPAFAQETDVVVLANGDRYTGEIKSYADCRLRLSTDDAGDVSIKWNKIVNITSDKTFDIELTDGTHIFGTLAPSTPPGRLDVVGDSGAQTIEYFALIGPRQSGKTTAARQIVPQRSPTWPGILCCRNSAIRIEGVILGASWRDQAAAPKRLSDRNQELRAGSSC